MSGHVARRGGRRPRVQVRRRPPGWRATSRRKLRAAVTSCLWTAARLWGNLTTLGGRRRDCELRTTVAARGNRGRRKRKERKIQGSPLSSSDTGRSRGGGNEAGRKGGAGQFFFFPFRDKSPMDTSAMQQGRAEGGVNLQRSFS